VRSAATRRPSFEAPATEPPSFSMTVGTTNVASTLEAAVFEVRPPAMTVTVMAPAAM